MAVPSRTQLKAPVEVPLGELRQHPGNPRRISDVRLEHLQRTMELDPGYCDVIRQRYADYTNQPQYAP